MKVYKDFYVPLSLGSAKMNHVAANSSTLSASSEQPQPAPPPPTISFGADPSNNVISVPKFQVTVFDLELLDFRPVEGCYQLFSSIP